MHQQMHARYRRQAGSHAHRRTHTRTHINTHINTHAQHTHTRTRAYAHTHTHAHKHARTTHAHPNHTRSNIALNKVKYINKWHIFISVCTYVVYLVYICVQIKHIQNKIHHYACSGRNRKYCKNINVKQTHTCSIYYCETNHTHLYALMVSI